MFLLFFFFMVRDTTQELKQIEKTRIKHIRVIISGTMTTKIMGQKNILRIYEIQLCWKRLSYVHHVCRNKVNSTLASTHFCSQPWHLTKSCCPRLSDRFVLLSHRGNIRLFHVRENPWRRIHGESLRAQCHSHLQRCQRVWHMCDMNVTHRYTHSPRFIAKGPPLATLSFHTH